MIMSLITVFAVILFSVDIMPPMRIKSRLTRR